MNLSEIFKWSSLVESHIEKYETHNDVFEIRLSALALEELIARVETKSIDCEIRKNKLQRVEHYITNIFDAQDKIDKNETAKSFEDYNVINEYRFREWLRSSIENPNGINNMLSELGIDVPSDSLEAQKIINKDGLEKWIDDKLTKTILKMESKNAIKRLKDLLLECEAVAINLLKIDQKPFNQESKLFVLRHAKKLLKKAEEEKAYSLIGPAGAALDLYIRKETDNVRLKQAKFTRELITTLQQLIEDRDDIPSLLDNTYYYTRKDGVKWGETFLKEAAEHLEKQAFALTQG